MNSLKSFIDQPVWTTSSHASSNTHRSSPIQEPPTLKISIADGSLH
jgi:hypothetical protein